MANVEHLKIRGDESLKKGIQKAIACLWRIKAGKDFYWAFYLGKNKVIVYGRDTLRIAKKRAKKQISSSSL